MLCYAITGATPEKHREPGEWGRLGGVGQKNFRERPFVS